MAFPVVEAITTYAPSLQVSTMQVVIPAGTVSGETLIIQAGVRAESFTTVPTGWNSFGLSGGSNTEIRCLWKKADGTEGGDTVSLPLTGAADCSAFCLRVSGATDPTVTPPEAAVDFLDVDGPNPDPPSLTPTGGAKDYLWLAGFFVRNTSNISSFPTNYTDNQRAVNPASRAHQGAIASRDLNASSEDPGVYTIATAGDWSTATIAVHPVGGGTSDNLLADDVESASSTTAATIGQTHALTANGAESASSTQAATIAQTHDLSSVDVESSSQLTVPTLTEQNTTDSLSANDVQSVSTVTQPAISQVHSLAANDAESASEVTAATIGQEHALTSVDISSLSSVSQPSLATFADVDVLSANDVESGSSVTAATIAQIHALQSTGVESASETETATITQIHALTATDTESASQVSAPTLRNPDQALAQPIRNTRATASQPQRKATEVTPTYNADIIETQYKVEVA